MPPLPPPAVEARAPAPASCAPAEQGCPAAIHLSAAQVFAIAEQLARKGKPDEAIRVLQVITQDKNPDYRAEARVRIARLLVAKGDLYGAARWYRRLLDEKPNAAAVRIELAQVLARLGDEQAAAGQLRRAQASPGLPEPVAQGLQRSVAYLRSQAPLSLDVSFGLAPDTNINAATTADSINIYGLPFALSQSGRATSGIGATYSAQLTARQKLGPAARWITQIGSSGNLYRDDAYDDVSFFASSGPEITARFGSIHPAITLGQRLYGASFLYDYYGESITALIQQGRKGQFTLSGSVQPFHYAAARAQQSGVTRTASLAYDRALSPRFTVHGGVSVSRADAQYAGYALTSASGEIAASRDFRPITLYGRVSYTRGWEGVDYPPFSTSRDDKTVEGDAGVIFRRLSFHGLSPQLKATYIRADSPINLFQYRRLRGEISLIGSF